MAKYYYIRSSRDTEQKHNELKKLQNLSLLHSDLVAKGLRCEVNRDEKGEPEAIGVFLEAKLEGTSTLTVKDNQVVVPTVKK